jgi:hypothetical protein
VSEREKDIRYSSLTQIRSNAFRAKHDVRHAINKLYIIATGPREHGTSEVSL